MNSTHYLRGLKKAQFMTSPSQGRKANGLRQKRQDTLGCVPVPGSIALGHVAAAGEAAKALGTTSAFDFGEANFTGLWAKERLKCLTMFSYSMSLDNRSRCAIRPGRANFCGRGKPLFYGGILSH